MSADTLRKAAALMRERAEAALDADHHWWVDEDAFGDRYLWASADPEGASSNAIIRARDITPPWTTVAHGGHMFDHIASWHPAVALAVAAWLDDAAHLSELDGEPRHFALAMARAYLGEVAP